MNAETITLADCLQCIHHVPCGCHFSTPGVYLPPHMENCHLSMDNDTHLPYTHVTNLAVLSHFFSEKDLGQFAADTLLNHPVHAILPNITLLDHNYSDTLAAIDRTRFQLSKAANLSISRQIAFRSMAEYLSHKQLTEYETEEASLLFTIPSTYTSPLILVSTALSAIALVFTVIVSIRLKALSLLFLNAKIASALPTTLDYYRTTPNIFLLSYRTTPVNVMESLSVTSILQITSICLLAALLVVLAYYYLFHKYMKAKDLRKPYCKIYLQLEFPSTHIYTYFMTLNSHISCYLFSARENLKSVCSGRKFVPLSAN